MAAYETQDYEYFSDQLPNPPLMTSRQAGWEDVGLERNYIPPGILSDLSINMHAIGINVGRHTNITVKVDEYRKKFSWLKGEFVIFPAALPVSVNLPDAQTSITVSLPHELLLRNAMELWDIEKFELIPSFPVRDPLVTQIGKALEVELKKNPDGCQLYAKTMANALAVHLLQNFSNRGHKITHRAGTLPSNKLNLVLDYIDSHLEQKIELADLAALIDYSQYHFSRAFKQATGLSPHQYVLQQRVELAKRLLLKRNMTISEVAITCGFSHQSHLNRHFKRLTGTTPKAFKNS